MGRRHAHLVAGIGVLTLLVAACGGTSTSSGGGAGADITFAAPVSLDGALSVEGQLTQHGYQYCATVVNQKGGITFSGQSHHLNLVTQNDSSTAANSATIVDQFNDKGYKFILSPYGSGGTAKVAPVVERNSQLMADSNGADPGIFNKGYNHTFGVLSLAPEYGKSIVDALAGLSPAPKTVAILAADDGFSQSSASGAAHEAQAKGMTLVPSADSYTSSTKVKANATDVSSALQAIGPSHPDVIMIAGHFNEPVAAIKQGHELNIKPALGYAATVSVADSKFVALGSTVNGVIGSTQWVPSVTTTTTDPLFGTAKDFASSYATAYPSDVVNGSPGYQAVDAVAACEVMVLAIEKAGSTDPEQVRSAMAALNFDSFYGHLQFDSTGADTTKPMQAIQIQGEPSSPTLVTIWPPNMTSGTAVWPEPAVS